MPHVLQNRVAQMGIDHQALMAPITKWTARLAADSVTETLEKAYAIATRGRPGAGHIGMPVDITATRIQSETISAVRTAPDPRGGRSDRQEGSGSDLFREEAADGCRARRCARRNSS